MPEAFNEETENAMSEPRDDTSRTGLLARLEQLKDITAIQCSQGNWDYDEYMRGMANGMILAVATMENKEPQYFDPCATLQTKREKDLVDAVEMAWGLIANACGGDWDSPANPREWKAAAEKWRDSSLPLFQPADTQEAEPIADPS